MVRSGVPISTTVDGKNLHNELNGFCSFAYLTLKRTQRGIGTNVSSGLQVMEIEVKPPAHGH